MRNLLDRLNELHEQSTPGKWYAYGNGVEPQQKQNLRLIQTSAGEFICKIEGKDKFGISKTDADFICIMKNSWEVIHPILKTAIDFNEAFRRYESESEGFPFDQVLLLKKKIHRATEYISQGRLLC